MIAAWVATLLLVPVLCFALGFSKMTPQRLHSANLVGACLTLLCALLPLAVPQLRDWQLLQAGGAPLLRLDDLSLVLPALAAALWLFSVAVTPRFLLELAGMRRTALATTFTTMAFLTENPYLLLTAWAASVVSLTHAQHTPGQRRRHWTGAYLVGSVLLFGAGVLLSDLAPEGSHLQLMGLGLLVAAALIRKGIFPFHAWVPALFEHGHLGSAILFCAPQVGTYAVAVLVVPHAPPEMLRAVAVVSLFTAVYAAAMALTQRSARRACAYLFASQSALVMAGLDGISAESLTGALVLWLSSSLAFVGLGRCLLVLEARRGRLDLSRYNGGYENKPLLATSFLLLGLSLTGFPGTLGFVGEELLLAGAVADFPLLGFLVVASGAFTGLAVLRMYFSLFCGAPATGPTMGIRPKEAVGFGVLVGALLLLGVFPAPLVRSREAASDRLIEHRAGLALPTAPSLPHAGAHPPDAP